MNKNDVRVDLFGNMEGQWICGNGHRNVIKESRRGDRREHVSEENTS
ncbi:MAG: hypothetical protein MN733_14420 [Nitrososphaera sp.]|nr:hypothetical protein [Nitrososphaera sp.]